MTETPRHVRATDRTPMSVGSFTRTITTPEDPFTARVMAFKNDDASNLEDSPDNWTAEKIRAAGDYFARANAKLTARHENADGFIALHEEFLDTERNGEAINRTLQTMYGDIAFTVDHFEAAYQV